MKSVRFSKFGDPEKVLQLEEIPIPNLNSNEVLVRIQSRPINPADLYQIMGIYGIKPELPATGGMEGAGIVEQVGAQVSGFKLGQKVILVKVGAGTWQEYVVVNPEQIILVPNELSIEDASMLIVNPMSAYLMTREIMKVSPGAWLLQTAAGSALGKIVIQLSKIYGFKTINIVRRSEQVKELLNLGADVVICSSDEPIEEKVSKITQGKGVQFAIDAVGGEVGNSVLKSLGIGGILLIYGALSSEGILINPGRMIFKSLSIKGFWLTRWVTEATPEQKANLLSVIMSLILQKKVHSKIVARYDLEKFMDAILHSKQTNLGGKILITS